MQGVTSIQSPPAAELHAGGTDASNEPTADPTAAASQRLQLRVRFPGPAITARAYACPARTPARSFSQERCFRFGAHSTLKPSFRNGRVTLCWRDRRLTRHGSTRSWRSDQSASL